MNLLNLNVMDTSEDLILKLDRQLENEHFKIEEFREIFTRFMDQFKTKLRILDFRYHDEKRKSRLKKLKIKYVMIQEFDKAAEVRKLEKVCDAYIELRDIGEIKKSMFFHYKDHLHFSLPANQKMIRQ